jgi:hypothetical protein
MQRYPLFSLITPTLSAAHLTALLMPYPNPRDIPRMNNVIMAIQVRSSLTAKYVKLHAHRHATSIHIHREGPAERLPVHGIDHVKHRDVYAPSLAASLYQLPIIP